VRRLFFRLSPSNGTVRPEQRSFITRTERENEMQMVTTTIEDLHADVLAWSLGRLDGRSRPNSARSSRPGDITCALPHRVAVAHGPRPRPSALPLHRRVPVPLPQRQRRSGGRVPIRPRAPGAAYLRGGRVLQGYCRA
jgi:hypothetical protein